MLIGPNGSGKSTLIKAILDLIPYSGDIKLHGRDINACPHAVGYIPQVHSIDVTFPLTVNEFLHFSHTNCPDYINRPGHINHTLALINAQDLIDTKLNQLSGGQLQRVLLARAIMHQPRLLILDEPEAGIDVGAEKTMYQLLIEQKTQHHVAMLIATHEIELAQKYADTVLVLNHSLLATGKPSQVLTPDKIKKIFTQTHI